MPDPALEPSELLVFISAFAPGDDGAIHAFALAPSTGTLRDLQTPTAVDTPFFMALSHDRQYLFSIDDFNTGNVSSFALTDRAGGLRHISKQSTRGEAACYVDAHPSGKVVLAANYTGGSVASYRVGDDGSLSEAVSFIEQQGAAMVDEGRQEKPHAHCFVIAPGGKFAYVPDLGLDQVLGFAVDSETAELTPARQPYVRTIAAAGPRHMTFHPSQPIAYVINELHNSVAVYDWDADSGALFEKQIIPTLPDDFDGVSHTADVKVTPCGRYVYGTNRGHDSIACYRAADDGTLSLIAITPSGGGGPQNLAVTPDGQWLICANMAGDCVTVFAIDSDTGHITQAGDTHTMPGPSCVMIVS